MRPSSSGLRVSYALLAGAITASVAWLTMPVVGSILLGWDVAVVLYLAWTWSSVWRLDPGDTAHLAKREGIQVKLYSIIYELIDQVKDAMAGLLDPETRETVVGHAEVRQVFELTKGNVALALAGAGEGVNLGLSVGAFTLTEPGHK